MTFTLPLSRRLLTLLFAVIIGFFITSVIAAFATHIFGPDSVKAMRIVVMLQDIFVFIVPAVLAAVLSTRQPAELMLLNGKIPALPLALCMCTMLMSIPAMNALIAFNESIPLPAEWETALKGMEENAQALIEIVQGPHTLPNLLMSILIVGIFAALSEELLFRGALQRMLHTGGLNTHAAVWIAAAVFSIMHLQFYGMIPRLLLGAFFGYALVWTRTIWVPVILHAFNNILYLTEQWLTSSTESISSEMASYPLGIMISVIATAVGIWLTWRIASAKICPKNLEN